MRTLRIGLCQINTTVGDIEGNTKKILDYIAKGKKMGADLLAFPEMAVTGYPPEDLLFMPKFIEANLKAVDRIAGATFSATAPDRPGHLLRPLASRRSHPDPSPVRRSKIDRQHLLFTLPRRKNRISGKDDLDEGFRQRGHRRLLQPRRRPG